MAQNAFNLTNGDGWKHYILISNSLLAFTIYIFFFLGLQLYAPLLNFSRYTRN